MCGALQGAEVRKDLLQADARERKYQCHSSREKTDEGMAIFTSPRYSCIYGGRSPMRGYHRGGFDCVYDLNIYKFNY